jgi:hypothetical protein
MVLEIPTPGIAFGSRFCVLRNAYEGEEDAYNYYEY